MEDNTKRLETKRLILRKFTMDDVEGVYNNFATDKETTKYLSWEPHKDISETTELISRWISEYENGTYYWAVELKETGEVIGSISGMNIDTKNSIITLGYCYGSKYWNKGYGTEVLRKVLEYLLLEAKFYLVEAYHSSENPASGRIMQKAGMKYDGTLRERRLHKDGTRGDRVYYSMKKEDL